MQERVPALKNRVGKKRPPSPWALLFITLFFAGTLMVLFLRSPLSKLETIETAGNRMLSRADILNRIGVKPGDWFFLVSGEEVKKRLEEMPEVKEARVVKEFPNRLYIRVEEKRRMAVFRAGNRLVPVLEGGVVLQNRTVGTASVNEPVFEGWSVPDDLLKEAVNRFAALPEAIRAEIKTVSPAPGRPDQVLIRTARNHNVIVRAGDLDRKMVYYPAFYGHEPGTVYLLESIWYSREGPDPGVEEKDDERNEHPAKE
ncbi:cell division protein FtsQ/DivIB [Staphylospora marina]|uniref:cell division protein FtsQ/DivIB n=1 Tax=Staphylospora marina TaxID=2490858 RepID=UPI000F5BD30A|nr:FtsQ-type POTRA domain-containing protein [Staphylospora marina]